MNELPIRLVEIFRAKNLPEAYIIRVALEEEGVRARVEGDQLNGAVGELPLGWASAPRVLVEESQEPLAREILANVNASAAAWSTQETSEEALRCLSCDEPMGQDQTACDACGWSFETVDPSSVEDDESR